MIPKFRAYHKELKVMYEVLAIDLFNKAVTVKFDKERYKIYSFDDVILMQFTGTKDINGNDIFESDIIRHTDFYLNSETVDKVYFKDGSFMYNVVVDKYNYDVPIGKILENSIVEVIGNVYQTPDLLERVEE